MIRFTLTVPSSGRPSLYAALHSAWAGGLTKDDEVLVVGDGPQPEARRIAGFFEDRLSVAYHETPPTRCVGMSQRNYAMKIATGSHLLFLDDDDTYTKGAISVIRTHVERKPEKVHMFRNRAISKRLSWDIIPRTPIVQVGNVGTSTIVTPNVQGKLGHWPELYEGDFHFVRETTGKLGSPIWHDEVIVDVK